MSYRVGKRLFSIQPFFGFANTRPEISPNARAACKAMTCNKAKILKGDLRVATWVSTGKFESWSWRHWGCFTPTQIKNAREKLGAEGEQDEVDMSLFDGWAELPEEEKLKVKVALEVGHVEDADWKGVCASPSHFFYFLHTNHVAGRRHEQTWCEDAQGKEVQGC